VEVRVIDFEIDDDWDDEDAAPGPSALDPDTKRVRILSEKCATCIFKPGNKMELREGARDQLVEETLAADSYIVCHSTLPYFKHPEAQPAVCRGFWDVHARDSLATRLVLMNNMAQWTEPPGGDSARA
jgi:hypothetical protein